MTTPNPRKHWIFGWSPTKKDAVASLEAPELRDWRRNGQTASVVRVVRKSWRGASPRPWWAVVIHPHDSTPQIPEEATR